MRVNPFLHPSTAELPNIPFQDIRFEDYEPAFKEGMELENKEIAQIVGQAEPPTFENTIVALDNCGAMLDYVSTVFFNQLEVDSNDAMADLAQRISPELSEHQANITLNPALFKRVKAVWERRSELADEDLKLLEKTYEGFERSGATLSEQDQATYRDIVRQLSQLTVQFSQNLLAETNNYTLHITHEADLEGLPSTQLEQAAHRAQEKGLPGWVFTLQAPSYVPFLTYVRNRKLRQELYMAYADRCARDNAYNNTAIVRQIVELRRQLARLLGYATYAHYALKHRMAQTPQRVNQLLDDLVRAYLPAARKEVARVEAFARQTEEADFTLEGWDFSYYSNLLKKQLYQFDDEVLRPYFELSRVVKGVLGLATRLYGIHFAESPETPVYHPDVKAYRVSDADGSPLGLLYMDLYPRAEKQGGAWMTNYCDQWRSADGKNHRPVVALNTNFPRPAGSLPSLLSFGEVETLLHEFGHTLHGLFANTRYRSLSGTHVYWDFVELPSQFMENFATEKDFLRTFAVHYQTGEPLPDTLIQKIVESRNFNVAYACIRQVSFGLLDMAYYTQTQPLPAEDLSAFEQQATERVRLLPRLPHFCMGVQFSHIMSGGYAAGYYSYKWAEVLDADAFACFKEHGTFNPDIAQRFRDCILSKGGTDDPMNLYVRFRQREPSIDALLTKNGIQ